jgi:peroxiredoxin
MLTSTDFSGLFNQRFFKNFLPVPAANRTHLGHLTPTFDLPDITHGARVKLSDYRGKQPVILDFTRIFTEKQYCPLCFPHIVALNEQYDRFKQAGIEVLMIASTDERQSQVVVRDLGLKLPLLSDPSCRVFRQYDVGQALGAPLPAQFVLDTDGRLRFKHLFSFLAPNASPDKLMQVLETLPESKSAVQMA